MSDEERGATCPCGLPWEECDVQQHPDEELQTEMMRSLEKWDCADSGHLPMEDGTCQACRGEVSDHARDSIGEA